VRQPVNKRGDEMGFHEEPNIGSLHIVILPHTSSLLCKQKLILNPVQMFYHRVVVNQIKAAILERKYL
jgi:hypothetical protein